MSCEIRSSHCLQGAGGRTGHGKQQVGSDKCTSGPAQPCLCLPHAVTQRSLSLPQAWASSHRQERTSSPAQFSPSTCGMLDRALEVSDTVNVQQGLLDECMRMSRCARAGGSGRGRDRSGAARGGGGEGAEHAQDTRRRDGNRCGRSEKPPGRRQGWPQS